MARLVDDLEARQLEMARDLQGFVEALMSRGRPSETELHSMIGQLRQALRDACRVAESRGDRLPAYEEDPRATAAADTAMHREIAPPWEDAPVAGFPPTGSEERHPEPVVRRWPNSPAYASVARRTLRMHLRGWGMEPLADTAELVLSELFNNAVQHAPGTDDSLIETRFERLPGGPLRIEVHDTDENKPRPRQASPSAEAGRGLALVEALTGGRWGVSDRHGIGKLVWAQCGGNPASSPPSAGGPDTTATAPPGG